MPLPVCLGFGPKSGRPGSACVRVAAGLQWVYPRFPWRVPSEGTLQAGFWRYYRLRRFFLWCLFYEKRCIHAPLREGSLGVPLVRNRFSRCASVFLKLGSRIYASTLGESLSFPLAIEAEKNGVLPVALGQSGKGIRKQPSSKRWLLFVYSFLCQKTWIR